MHLQIKYVAELAISDICAINQKILDGIGRELRYAK